MRDFEERAALLVGHSAVGRAAAVVLLSGLVAFPATSDAGVATGDSMISTVAGSERGFAGDGGPAAQALLNQPRDTEVSADGTIYVADTFNNRIRKISPDGTISTIAGTGSPDYNGDGVDATTASLHWPHDVTVDDAGVVFIADAAHHRIRMVGLDGIITTIAGTGEPGSTGDGGPATEARIQNPKSVAVHDGALYFSSLEDKVRRVDLTSGIITTVAGTGVPGYTGDGGLASEATLSGPQRLAIDSDGNIYVADTGNSVVRRIDAVTGLIATVAGDGTPGTGGNGDLATSARIDHPRGIALGSDQVLYIADSDSHCIRRVNLKTGVIRRMAGTTEKGFSGDGGPAGEAQLYQPRGLSVTPGGDLLIADTLNDRVRLVLSSADTGEVAPG
ncbi:NHL domain-containing protein [Nocardioides pyridinolyticus]